MQVAIARIVDASEERSQEEEPGDLMMSWIGSDGVLEPPGDGVRVPTLHEAAHCTVDPVVL